MLLWCPLSEHEVMVTDPLLRVVQDVPAVAEAVSTLKIAVARIIKRIA